MAAQLIELANEGALDGDRFREFIAETARAIGAPSGNVLAFQPGTSTMLFAAMIGPNYSERVLQLYQSDFMHIEPHRKFVTREHMASDAAILLCHDFISETD